MNWKSTVAKRVESGEKISRKMARELGLAWSTLHSFVHRDGCKIKEKKKDKRVAPSFYVGKNVEDNSSILLISDMHIPYHHKNTLEFLAHLKDKHKPTRIISLGDECYPPDVEILTEDGFVRFDDLQDQLVAQWHEDGSISYVEPKRKVVKEYVGDLLEYRHKTVCVRTTPKHNLVKVHPTKGTIHRREAWDVYGSESWHIPRFGLQDGKGIGLTDDEIRLYVAFQADGTFTKGAARFGFTKTRKSERLQQLLQNCSVPFTTHIVKRGDFQYYIKVEDVPKYFTKTFNIPAAAFSSAQKEVFLRELGHWDGTSTKAGVRYTSAIRENVEHVAQMALTGGYYVGKIKMANANCAYLDITWQREKTSLKSCTKTLIPYNGLVYCVTVDTGMIIVRTDGHTIVCGNCDQHALSFHDSDADLYSAGDELRKTQEVMKQLEKMFPKMDLLDSNHGSLIYRRAKHHGIPKHYIKGYNEILGVGDGWKWHNDMILYMPNGEPVYFCHGKAQRGVQLSQNMGMSVVQGHHHSEFNIHYWSNPIKTFFSLQCGSLVDDTSLAMEYNKLTLKRPIVGTAVIVDGKPILEMM